MMNEGDCIWIRLKYTGPRACRHKVQYVPLSLVSKCYESTGSAQGKKGYGCYREGLTGEPEAPWGTGAGTHSLWGLRVAAACNLSTQEAEIDDPQSKPAS